jgi:hypothetical protein
MGIYKIIIKLLKLFVNWKSRGSYVIQFYKMWFKKCIYLFSIVQYNKLIFKNVLIQSCVVYNGKLLLQKATNSKYTSLTSLADST